MIRPTLRPQDLSIGQLLPPISKTFSAADLMAYGAATWDWHRVHYDLVRAREIGFPNVFVDGQTYGAIFARHAMDWLGPKAFIRKMRLQYRTMVFAGETIAGTGAVIEVQILDDCAIVVLSLELTKDTQLVSSCRMDVRLPL